MLPFVTAEQLLVLRDGTGKAFAQFVDSVVRACAGTLGVLPTDVHTNMKVTVPDGGVDTQVDGNGHDLEGRLQGPTLWQYKAQELKDVTEAKIHKEIHGRSKEYARELIRKGYAYRLCVCDDTSNQKKLELQETLDKAVKQISSSALPSKILLLSDIAAWANQYPAVVAKWLHLPIDIFRYFDSWKPSAVGNTPTFVPTEHFEPLRARVQAHLDWSRKPVEVALTVFGDAGVGKTRAVFEVLNDQPNQRELLVYTVDEQAAIRVATALANDAGLKAILVSDECLSRAKFQLATILRGIESRVRLITIDNAQERSRSVAPELQVLRTTEEETLKVLDANFEIVPPDRRRRYASIAKGFLRFAIHMCSHDAEIQESGSLSSVLQDAQSYYEYLFSGFGFDAQDREAIEIVSLIERVGYREDRAGELEELCKLVDRDPQQTRERIEKIRTRTGLIASAGRFYYVTPSLIAMIAFESAWRRWVAPDPYRFLKAIPDSMVEIFQNRVSSASREVGAIVGQFFREWTVTRGPAILESASETRRLVALVTADPKNQAPLLRTLVELATPEQLHAGADGAGVSFGYDVTPRRLLISVAEELAQFQDFFGDAEAVLFRLASEETEPSIGNNATHIWTSLFGIFLSGTDTPFQKRYELLRQRFAAGTSTGRLLAISAAAASVDQRPFRTVGPPLFGSLVPPPNWRPNTYGEYFDAIKACVELLRDGCFDRDPIVSDAAKKALLSAVSHVLWSGIVEPVRAPLEEKLPVDMQPRLAALVREAYSKASAIETPGSNPETRNALHNWLATLESKTLHDRLIENIAAEPWSHHFDEEKWRQRVSDLAKALYDDPESFAKELVWLNSGEAKAATELGHFLGRYDANDLRFLDLVVDIAIKHKSDGFARGYVYGATESSSIHTDRLNQCLDRIQADDPRLAYYVMLPSGDAVRSFGRAMSMVSAGLIPPHLLANLEVWVGNRKTSPEEASSVVRLLLPFLKSGDRVAGDIAIDFVAYQINRVESKEQKLLLLVQMFGESLGDLWILMEAIANTPGREGFWFVKVLEAAAPLNPIRACQIASAMMVSDDYQFSQQGEELIVVLAQRHPQEAMEAIGALMTDDDRAHHFFIRKFPVLATLPYEVVTSWLKRVGVSGARAIARHLQPPFLDAQGQPQVPPLTEFVLTCFEGDDRTFSEFVAGVHSFQMYSGNIAAAYERESSIAKAFLGSKLKRVREWAITEMRQADENARRERVRQEEFGLR